MKELQLYLVVLLLTAFMILIAYGFNVNNEAEIAKTAMENGYIQCFEDSGLVHKEILWKKSCGEK